MNDNNNLCKGAKAMLKTQLGALEPCDRVQIAVEYSHLREPSMTHPSTVTHRRAEIGNKRVNDLADLPVVDMAAPETIENFLRWGIEKYPAKHYAVIFQSHGGAWRASMPDEAAGALRDGPVDEPYAPHPSTTISMPALSRALAEVEATTGVRPDVLAFDSCLMGNTEAAYELRDRGGLLVASEDIISSTPSEYALDYAVPLQPILQRLSDRLAAGEHVGADTLGKDWVEACATSWTTPTQSAFRLGAMEDVARALDRLAGALLDADAGVLREVVAKARHFSEKKAPDRFDREWDYKLHLKDVRDLVDQVRAEPRLEAAWQSAADVMKALSQARVAHQSQEEIHAVGRTSYGEPTIDKREPYDGGRTHGLSIYLPDNAKIADRQREEGNFYENLAFAADTRWPMLMAKLTAEQQAAPGSLN